MQCSKAVCEGQAHSGVHVGVSVTTETGVEEGDDSSRQMRQVVAPDPAPGTVPTSWRHCLVPQRLISEEEITWEPWPTGRPYPSPGTRGRPWRATVRDQDLPAEWQGKLILYSGKTRHLTGDCHTAPCVHPTCGLPSLAHSHSLRGGHLKSRSTPSLDPRVCCDSCKEQPAGSFSFFINNSSADLCVTVRDAIFVCHRQGRHL